MPNNPKKKAGDSGKAAADMMAGLMEYLAMTPQQGIQPAPMMPVAPPQLDPAMMRSPETLKDLIRSNTDNYYRELYSALGSKDLPWDQARQEADKVRARYPNQDVWSDMASYYDKSNPYDRSYGYYWGLDTLSPEELAQLPDLYQNFRNQTSSQKK